MQAYFTLVRREVGSLFMSWTGYVILAAVMFLLGLSFTQMLHAFNMQPTPLPITQLFYNTLYFWYVLLIVSPVITMRSFALEKSTGTFETLMTTPVRDAQVVLAKFTGALVFFLILWLPLLPCLFITRHFSSDPSGLGTGTVLSTYLGIGLLGCVYMAMGVFASALTRSQINAAMVGYALGITLFMFSFLGSMIPSQSGAMGDAVAYLALMEHMGDFARGVVDLRPVVFYLSLTGLFLFMTWKVVESRRWK